MLRLTSVSAFYDRIQVLRGVSLHVAPGELVALIGTNGSGKSTILRAISGQVKRRRGRIVFDGHDISRASPAAIVRLGLVQVPEQAKGRDLHAQNLRQQCLNRLQNAEPISSRVIRLLSYFYNGLVPHLRDARGIRLPVEK